MNIETAIELEHFKPRDYQRNLINAITKKGFKKAIAVWPRRAGKDIVALNLAVNQCLEKVCTVFYIFPTYSMGRKILWDAIDNEGHRIMDWYIPYELIESKHSQEMKIKFKNGSQLCLLGSDNYDMLVGTNCYACIFSEYALQDPRVYQYLRPILLVSGGWALFISTPRGHNALWEMAEIAKHNPDEWFFEMLTTSDTRHIPLELIEKEINEGLISRDLAEQEYNCSFDLGQEGSYFAKYLQAMKIKGRIGEVPYETGYKVHTSWDLGVHDPTCILFIQVIGAMVRIIDCYTNNDVSLDHYAKILQQKNYLYGKHIAPHDIRVRDFSQTSGQSRLEVARHLGINFVVAPSVPLEDGIEATRAALNSKIWIDEKRCNPLLKALENYHREFDPKKKTYKEHPCHDWSSNYCFVGETLIKTDQGDKQIKDIKVGDKVITPLGIRKVLKTHKKLSNSMCRIKTSDATLECTPEHKIFTQSGLVYSDTLRYNDVLEKYSKSRSWIWQKAFGYFLREQDFVGFKKTILSQKMKPKSSLMDTFLGGMEIITEKHELCSIHPLLFKEPFGHFIKEKYQKIMRYITKIKTEKTITSKTLNVSLAVNTREDTNWILIPGRNLNDARNYYEPKMLKLQNGIEAKQEGPGIENMQNDHCHQSREQDILKNVRSVQKIISQNKSGKNSALVDAKQKTGLLINWTLWIALAVYAKLYSIVINTLLRKHVVKSVKLYQCDTPKEVYDITVEQDNCYYANGYLVSNSDALRYLCLSLSKLTTGSSSEDLDRRYADAMQGNAHNIPRPFQDPNSMF